MRCYAPVDGRRARGHARCGRRRQYRRAGPQVVASGYWKRRFNATPALLGEAEGAVDAALALTLEYLNTRAVGKKLLPIRRLALRICWR